MVKVVLEDGEERAIGDTYNIEVMRRNRLHCSCDSAAGRQLRETNSPVVTSWLLLNDEDNQDNNIPESFISKSIIMVMRFILTKVNYNYVVIFARVQSTIS